MLVMAFCLCLGGSAEIQLPGGVLRDEWRADGHIYMTGPAETVYTGEFE